jgi:hypothetical protein
VTEDIRRKRGTAIGIKEEGISIREVIYNNNLDFNFK